jgi:hypothetical protein
LQAFAEIWRNFREGCELSARPKRVGSQGALTATYRNNLEVPMPVLLVPLLIGVPVLIGGGYFIIKAFH